MKAAVALTFVLALIGGGMFLLGVSRGIYSFEMTGFILTLPLTLVAALGLMAVIVGLVAAGLMALRSALARALASAWPHRMPD